MAKTPSEKIFELRIEVELLRQRADAVRRDLDRITVEQKETDTKFSKHGQDLMLLTQRLDEHLKRLEERDRRGWVLAGIVMGAILSFGAQILLTLIRR